MLNQNNSTKLRRPAIHGGITTTARLLGERMEDLALHLLGTANKKLSTRNELRFGNRGSTSVNIGGAEPGVWYDHEAGKGGGALELIQHVQNCDLKEACAWAENWLGLAPMPAASPLSAPKTRKRKAAQLQPVETEVTVIEPISMIEDCDPAAWAHCIQVNLIGAFNVLRACLPKIAAGGRVANISSGAAEAEHAGWSAYAASKAGLERLSATLANERPDLSVYAVRPGVTDTGMQAEIRASTVDNAIRRLKKDDLQSADVPAMAIASLFGASQLEIFARVVESKSIPIIYNHKSQ